MEKLNPNGLSYYKAKAVYQLEVEKDKVASLLSLDKALNLQPDDPDALFLHGFLAFQLGQMEKSLLSMERAYHLDPENGRMAYFLSTAYEMNREYAKMVPFLERLLELEPEKTHYGVQAKYYQFLADGRLESYEAFENAVKTVERTNQCDSRSIQDNEMVVAMFNEEFKDYTAAWEGKWDNHHKGHGNWSCPMILNEETNHAKLILEHSHNNALALDIIEEVRKSSTRPIDENSMCIFNKAVYEPKLDIMEGDTASARKKFDDVVFDVIKNDKFPRGAVEKVVLLQTADMVEPERVYSIYRQVLEAPVTLVGMESICANPWLYPNLIKDPQFKAEVKQDGRFVEFLEHYGYWKET
ncbi:MAG: hypothetical protein KDD32_07960 [Bacteroidetes bacterium]|nr:hypothetical protein [Bacteroidota bacterium]